jgi:hypothetical protein
MTSISSEQIRDIAIRTVEQFLNNKVPLSQGLAKEASAAQLNSEQLQRAVEATNNISYLKVLELSTDRTVEFALCKTAEVMQHIAVPDGLQEKVASAMNPEMVKQAAVIEGPTSAEYSGHDWSENEVLVNFIKQASTNKAALESLKMESLNVGENLVKAAAVLKKDAKWMDKLACVSDGVEYKMLSLLVDGTMPEHRDLKDLGLFKEAELKSFSSFAQLYKQARQITREMTERAELQKRADDMSTMQRVKNIVQNPAQSVGKAIGYGPGKAIGTVANKVVNAPVNAVKSVAQGAANTFNDALGSMGKPTIKTVGKATGQTVKAIGESVASKAGKIGRFAMGPVADVAMYAPGTDDSTGRSNDVWSALQKS